MAGETLFDALTPLGFRIRTTPSYWELIITVKHPIMYGHEGEVADVLRFPDEIRRSRSDPSVYLFYRVERPGRWTCVVIKQLDGDGFVVTAYPTDTIKEGERVWTK